MSPHWRRRGYITLVRRNWHLLPYEQLLMLVVLHLLGLDQEKLTWYHNGLDRRLTDVHGYVIADVLA